MVRELPEERGIRRYMKKCRGLAEIAVVEVAEIGGGVRSRESDLGKRIREDLASAYVELRSTRRRVLTEVTGSVSLLDGSEPARSVGEANCVFGKLSPLWSSNTSGDLVEDEGTISGQEGQTKRAQLETVTFYGGRERYNSFSPSESQAVQSGDMESSTGRRPTEANSLHGAIDHEMPSESEMEDFFGAAEQDIQKRFSERYNFDTIKGVPLEGRYEWIPVHHEWS